MPPTSRLLALLLALAALAAPALAQDRLKVAVGQRGVFENAVSELGQDAGFFKKRGLALDILYTQGGGETQQVVISGGADVGIGVGAYGAMGAFAKGAPVRALGATMRGYYEVCRYVPSTSPIQTLKDAAGKTIAYSTTGSSTQVMTLALGKQAGVALKPTATGGPPQTFTQVMTGQIDIGWTAPPLMVDALDAGASDIVARGDDVPAYRDQPVRLILANAQALDRDKDRFTRYMAAYRETIEWLWSSPDALKAYAKWAQVSDDVARRTRDEFVHKDRAAPDRVEGLVDMMGDAVALKFLAQPLTKEQLADFVKLQPEPKLERAP